MKSLYMNNINNKNNNKILNIKIKINMSKDNSLVIGNIFQYQNK